MSEDGQHTNLAKSAEAERGRDRTYCSPSEQEEAWRKHLHDVANAQLVGSAARRPGSQHELAAVLQLKDVCAWPRVCTCKWGVIMSQIMKGQRSETCHTEANGLIVSTSRYKTNHNSQQREHRGNHRIVELATQHGPRCIRACAPLLTRWRSLSMLCGVTRSG